MSLPYELSEQLACSLLNSSVCHFHSLHCFAIVQQDIRLAFWKLNDQYQKQLLMGRGGSTLMPLIAWPDGFLKVAHLKLRNHRPHRRQKKRRSPLSILQQVNPSSLQTSTFYSFLRAASKSKPPFKPPSIPPNISQTVHPGHIGWRIVYVCVCNCAVHAELSGFGLQMLGMARNGMEWHGMEWNEYAKAFRPWLGRVWSVGIVCDRTVPTLRPHPTAPQVWGVSSGRVPTRLGGSKGKSCPCVRVVPSDEKFKIF